MGIIRKIQSEFLKEAKNSPMLLSDLAHMETYIAESYHNRSIIELLQNADDAGSSRFYISKNQGCIIVANDGRFFNENDILSICRSGSSTKKRDGNSIGYRGIGFKSVVNLAERVHIISDNLGLTFSRELTNEVIDSDIPVPLIRIPHKYNPLMRHSDMISDLMDRNFKTIFIFEKTNPNNLEEEIDSFDSSSLLFLRNIKQVEFVSLISKTISVKRANNGFEEYITIINDGYKEEWLVLRNSRSEDKITSVAFLLDNKKRIIPLSKERSVVHSFMPTKDNVGLPFKINGDFSTDPSRTKTVNDDLSKESLSRCSELIIDIVKEYINGGKDDVFTGLFEVLSTAEESLVSSFSSVLKFKDLFLKNLKDQLKKEKWFNNQPIEKIRINPEWLNFNDFNRLCEFFDFTPLDKRMESKYPGILKFGEKFGVKPLLLEEILEATNKKTPTINGSQEIIGEFIRKNRFSHNTIIQEKMKNAKIIYFSNGVFSLNEKTTSKFDEEFLELIEKNLNDPQDFKWFINKMQPSLISALKDEDQEDFGNDNEVDVFLKNKGIETLNKTQIFSKSTHQRENNSLMEHDISKKSLNIKASISKWRTAETNLAAFLEMDEDVKKVIDVSKSNLGYDLEVQRLDRTEYVEVKSVDKLGSTISLTNNEYSTAHELKDSYILAIVKQTNDGLEVCYIKNPIDTLQLTKRVTRWEWICDNYSGDFSNYFFD